ncbi:MAG: Txe/YoeB family addiction module toxin [Rectinemataceae bacterium]
MNKLFTDEAWKDYIYWFENDKKQLKRINNLIKEMDRTPFEGIGKPEALKYDMKGYWSRRIDHEHRLVYRVEDDSIVFIAFRFHYAK